MKVARISFHFSLGPKTNTYGIEMVVLVVSSQFDIGQKELRFHKPFQKYSLSRPGGPMGSPPGQPIVCPCSQGGLTGPASLATQVNFVFFDSENFYKGTSFPILSGECILDISI